MVNLDKSSYRVEVIRPVWMPFNDVAYTIVESLVHKLGYPTTGPKAEKYAVMIASIIKAAQTLPKQSEGRKPKYVGVSFGSQNWSRFPLVGREVAVKVLKEVFEYLDAKLVDGSGKNWHQDSDGKWYLDPKMSMYHIRLSLLPSNLLEARFIEVGRPLVKVNSAEARQQKIKRKEKNLLKGFLKYKEANALDRDALRASEGRIQSLNEFWLDHPLVLPNGNAAASATRVFHDARFDAGGRIYGAWTGLDQKEHRIYCTIDDEPICEIDIRASQPTLFSSLLGYKLGGLEKNSKWGDVYGELSGLLIINHSWTRQTDDIDAIELMKLNRNIAKQVVMAVLGTGIAEKPKLTEEVGGYLKPDSWKHFRETLQQIIPAFEKLEPRYDKDGKLTGYLNGAGFLSYHESEMMLKTLGQLVELGIPAYPVHDSLMVKVIDAKVTARVFRQVIHDYCKQLSGLEVLVPLSVTVASGSPRDLLPSDKDLEGTYLN